MTNQEQLLHANKGGLPVYDAGAVASSVSIAANSCQPLAFL